MPAASVGERRRWPALVTALSIALLALVALTAAPAAAHEEEGSQDAGVLVRQAIALIVNTPSNRMAIEDKIDDALKTKRQQDVAVSLVEEAKDGLGRGDIHQARAKLEASIGATPHAGPYVLPVRETSVAPSPALVTGAETGTNVAGDPLVVRRRVGGQDAVLLALSIAAIAAGVVLAVRFRPPVPIRELHTPAGSGRAT